MAKKPVAISYGEWLADVSEVQTNGCVYPPLKPHHSGYVLTGGGGYPMSSAHRDVWQFWNGPIPDGLMVDHTCRDRRCCNVYHLRIVTPKINAVENVEGAAWQLQAAKTDCPQGHPYVGSNLYIAPNGDRMCRRCRAEASAKYKRKVRAAR